MQVNFRGIDESSKELGASNRVEALQGSVDIHRGTDFRCRRGCLALQHLQANRQVLAAGYNQDLAFAQRLRSCLLC